MENQPEYQKEGLQSAIDFTKYIITLSCGAIAFVIQPTFLGGSRLNTTIATLTVITLSISIIAGMMVHARGSVMLARKEYDINDRHMARPGLICQVSFLASFMLLGAATIQRLWFPPA